MNRIFKSAIAALLPIIFSSVAYSATVNADAPPKSGDSEKTEVNRVATQDEHQARVNAEVQAAVERLENKLAELQNNKRRINEELLNISKKIRDICGVSPENVKPTMLNLEREIMQLKVEMDVKQVTEMAISKELEKALAAVDKDEKSDQVVKNLKSLIDTRQKAFELLNEQYKMGKAPFSDVNNAEAELAEAKIRLETRKEELSKGDSAAGVKLIQLLRENTLSKYQTRARLDALQDQYKNFNEPTIIVNDYIERNDMIPRLNRQIERIEDEIFYLENNLGRDTQIPKR